MFFSIFGLTAVLTILSLPGWIPIPEWYRQKLFVALLLEVVAAVLILFRHEILNMREQPGVDKKVDPNTVLISSFSRGSLNVHRPDSLSPVPIGFIPRDSLVSIGMFNSLAVDQWQSVNNPLVEWRPSSASPTGWKKTGFDMAGCPFTFEVYGDLEEGGRTRYKIIDTRTGEVVYWSKSRGIIKEFDDGNRMLHYMQDGSKIYLFRIDRADLGAYPFVYVWQVTLTASLQE